MDAGRGTVAVVGRMDEGDVGWLQGGVDDQIWLEGGAGRRTAAGSWADGVRHASCSVVAAAAWASTGCLLDG
ncbi:hypothetical protein ACLOJK_004414 [Asimina triloba]